MREKLNSSAFDSALRATCNLTRLIFGQLANFVQNGFLCFASRKNRPNCDIIGPSVWEYFSVPSKEVALSVDVVVVVAEIFRRPATLFPFCILEKFS